VKTVTLKTIDGEDEEFHSVQAIGENDKFFYIYYDKESAKETTIINKMIVLRMDTEIEVIH